MYDRFPATKLEATATIHAADEVWAAIGLQLSAAGARGVAAIDCYPGVDIAGLIEVLRVAYPTLDVIDAEEAALSADGLDARFGPNLTSDRVLGVMSHATVADFYAPDEVAALQERVAARPAGVILVGWGASYLWSSADVVVLADLARWEIQQRYRSGMANWHANNADEDTLRKVKRGYFLEWPTADRHKRGLLAAADFVLDMNNRSRIKLLEGDAFRRAMSDLTSRPFRLAPYFDPGVWGGQWMKGVCGLDPESPNYAWSFDGVPEENSVVFTDGVEQFEMPAMDLTLLQPKQLLGERTFARFGADFPIRFDLLDTMEGGNLSLQVHPLTDYIHETFGMSYTQDESYYLLDAHDDAVVYLGLSEGVDRSAIEADLREAAAGGTAFPAERYVNTFPARKHDHFSIPAGTVHCSGANSMILEISATPFLFTFKMWDWGRVGLDGVPRPIHLDHALANIQWDRDPEWVEANLAVPPQVLAEGDGWVEERTGLHALEFLEVRRHWFDAAAPHHTNGTVNMLNLVEGAEAIVESPTGAFPPFIVHYAETFIVPAAVGAYTIRPYGEGVGQRLATVKAYVRGTQDDD